MQGYDASLYDPPAAVAHVALRNPENGEVAEALLQLDTGADITLLPRSKVQRLGLSPMAEQCELVGFDGSRSTASVVMVDMILLNKTFRGRYVLIEEERGILGRDVLNHLTLLLDGPQQQWSEYRLPPNNA